MYVVSILFQVRIATTLFSFNCFVISEITASALKPYASVVVFPCNSLYPFSAGVLSSESCFDNLEFGISVALPVFAVLYYWISCYLEFRLWVVIMQ